MTASDSVIGIDLGGTKILACAATCEGEIVARRLFSTGAEQGGDMVLKRLLQSVREVAEKAGFEPGDAAGIGIGAPGFLDAGRGMIYFAGNLHWENVPLCELVEGEFGVPVWLDNDANLAALAESRLGAGIDREDMIYITVSTGIGGGIILDGAIEHGSRGLAGEFGHITILPDGPPCNCGNSGCLEVLASGTALVRMARERVPDAPDSLLFELASGDPENITGPMITRAADDGDALARELFDTIARYLGIGVANLINLYNPEMIVIGGGVSQAGSLLFDGVRAEVRRRVLKIHHDRVQIVPAQLGEEVGVQGAVTLATLKVQGS